MENYYNPNGVENVAGMVDEGGVNPAYQQPNMNIPIQQDNNQYKFCFNCGSRIFQNSSVCPNCGVVFDNQPSFNQNMNAYNPNMNGYNSYNPNMNNYANYNPNPNYSNYNPNMNANYNNQFANPNMGFDAVREYQKLAEYEKTSGIIWLVIGIIQCLSIVGIICGIWNIIAATSRMKFSKQLETMPSGVYSTFENDLTNTIIVLVLNIFLGAFIGVVGAAFDLYVRSYVMDRRQIFDN